MSSTMRTKDILVCTVPVAGVLMSYSTRSPLGLGHDVVHELIACDTRNILHPRTHLGRVATKSQVGACPVERKHVHVAVVEGLALVGQLAQKLVARGASTHGHGTLDQCHGLVGCALLQTEGLHRA